MYSKITFLLFQFFTFAYSFKVSDTGSGMFVHVFGSYFGLAVSFALKPLKNTIRRKDKSSSCKTLFTIGITRLSRCAHKLLFHFGVVRHRFPLAFMAELQRLFGTRRRGQIESHNQHVLLFGIEHCDWLCLVLFSQSGREVRFGVYG